MSELPVSMAEGGLCFPPTKTYMMYNSSHVGSLSESGEEKETVALNLSPVILHHITSFVSF